MKFADAELEFGPTALPASTDTWKPGPNGGAVRLAYAPERKGSLHIANVVPTVVTPSHITVVLMVAADKRLTANARERTYRNIGFLLSLPRHASLGGLTPLGSKGFSYFYCLCVLNVVLDKTGIKSRLDAQTKAAERYGSHLLACFMPLPCRKKPFPSRWNGKVYIGLVAAAPNLEPHDIFLAITPFYSGYRDRQTLRLVLTVDYLNVYDQHGFYAEDSRVVVPVASIRMASIIDQAAYPAFIVEAGEPQPEPPTIC
jgi:hypothetical protein